MSDLIAQLEELSAEAEAALAMTQTTAPERAVASLWPAPHGGPAAEVPGSGQRRAAQNRWIRLQASSSSSSDVA